MAPRKDELLALAAKHPEVTVDPGATNAQIIAALADAGIDVNEASARAPQLEVGDPVTFTYNDAADNELVRYGTVVELVDNVNAHPEDGHTPGRAEQGARVAWLGDVSDPIPLDQLELSR